MYFQNYISVSDIYDRIQTHFNQATERYRLEAPSCMSVPCSCPFETEIYQACLILWPPKEALNYPLENERNYGKSLFFNGEINYKWQFSIATVGFPGICEHTLSGEKWCFSIAKCRNSQRIFWQNHPSRILRSSQCGGTQWCERWFINTIWLGPYIYHGYWK